MTDEMRFFLFLIERYADHKGRPTGDVLREWDQKGVKSYRQLRDPCWKRCLYNEVSFSNGV